MENNTKVKSDIALNACVKVKKKVNMNKVNVISNTQNHDSKNGKRGKFVEGKQEKGRTVSFRLPSAGRALPNEAYEKRRADRGWPRHHC